MIFMIYPEDIQLFSIHEFSRACGVSRASLLRMEECGFLTSCRIDSETGYRYYDAHNAAGAGQFKLL
jgi:DNA-binding transcriptional MerR regulator